MHALAHFDLRDVESRSIIRRDLDPDRRLGGDIAGRPARAAVEHFGRSQLNRGPPKYVAQRDAAAQYTRSN
jgi:hypothetical protein